MKNTKGFGIQQLLLAVIAVSALSIAIGSGRQKSPQRAISASIPSPAGPAPKAPPSLVRFSLLLAAALFVLGIDAYWVVQLEEVRANAVGATLVAVGAVLVLLAGSDPMGLSKRNWRKPVGAFGNIFAAFGAGVLLCGAWLAVLGKYPWPWF